MSTLVLACTKGKIGTTEYYSAQMDLKTLLSSTSLAQETDEWLTLGVQERYQREIADTRIRKEIAPYFAFDDDRFVGSFVIALNNPEVFKFQSVANITGVNLEDDVVSPSALIELDKVGILTIHGGRLVIIDGQHRRKGLELAFNAKFNKDEIIHTWHGNTEDIGDFENDLFNVIIVKTEEKGVIRKIFNNINKHARKTAKKDDIITSMEDGCAFVSRNLISRNSVLGDRFEKRNSRGDLEPSSMINWKQNTVSARSIEFTSMSGLYNLNKIILMSHGFGDVVDSKSKPSAERLEQAEALCDEWWTIILDNVEAYQIMIDAKRVDPDWRKGGEPRYNPMHKWLMLFLPQGQFVMLEGVSKAIESGQISLQQAISKINQIDWSLDGNSHLWDGVFFASNGTLLRQTTNKRLAAFIVEFSLLDGKVKALGRGSPHKRKMTDCEYIDYMVSEIRKLKGDEKWEVFP